MFIYVCIDGIFSSWCVGFSQEDPYMLQAELACITRKCGLRGVVVGLNIDTLALKLVEDLT